MGLDQCTVCNHPQRNMIDAVLAAGSLGRRTVANQYGLTDSAVQRHRARHLTKRIVKAVERAGAKADDVFMQRHEHLYAETLQYVEDAKQAVKMQKVTEEIETDDGIRLQDRYKSFRDIGAMAPALQTAVQLQRVLGDATARFSSQAAGATSISLCVVMPRDLSAAPAPAQPALASGTDVIECEAIEPASEPSEPPATDPDHKL